MITTLRVFVRSTQYEQRQHDENKRISRQNFKWELQRCKICFLVPDSEIALNRRSRTIHFYVPQAFSNVICCLSELSLNFRIVMLFILSYPFQAMSQSLPPPTSPEPTFTTVSKWVPSLQTCVILSIWEYLVDQTMARLLLLMHIIRYSPWKTSFKECF